MRMAEQSTSSSSTGSRKRHKPIEPPSPEPSSRRHHLPLNSGDQQFFQRPQRYSSSTTSTSAASGYRNLNDLGSTHELRTKASVFDRLGGNVVSPPKRPNPCVNWMNTGTCPRGRQCHYLHPPHSPENSSARHQYPRPSRHDYPQPAAQPQQQQQSRPSYHYENQTNFKHGGGHHQHQHHQQRHHYRQDSDLGHEEPPSASSSSTNIFGQSRYPRTYRDDQAREQRRPVVEEMKRSRSSSRYEHSSSKDRHHHQPPHHHQHHQHRNGDRDRDVPYAASVGSADDVKVSDHENAKLRSKVVVTKPKIPQKQRSIEGSNGAASNAKRISHIPRHDEGAGDNREQDSEEALERRLKEIKRQLEELEEGGESRESASGRHRASKRRKEESSSRLSNKNGVISEKRYRNDDQAGWRMEKEQQDHGRPKEDQTTLTQQKLEPISDEEVEESSGESSSAPAYNRVEDAEASTSAAASAPGKQSQVEQVLNVAWDQALPEQKPASTSGLGGDGGGGGGGGRRQIFDVDYFLPTIGVCKEFLDELTLEEATTAAAGGEKSDVDALLKKQAAMKRIRLVNDVGSSYRRAMSARVDLKMRRQLCGLVAEADVTSNTMESNVPLNGRTFRKALDMFEKWTTHDDDGADGQKIDFRTTL